MPDSGGLLTIALVVFAGVLIARPFVHRFIIHRRRAGTISDRKAAWLYGATIGAPYIFLLVAAALTAPSILPLLILLMALTLPVFFIAWVALYRAAR